jgi:hypothetical protein
MYVTVAPRTTRSISLSFINLKTLSKLKTHRDIPIQLLLRVHFPCVWVAVRRVRRTFRRTTERHPKTGKVYTLVQRIMLFMFYVSLLYHLHYYIQDTSHFHSGIQLIICFPSSVVG